MHNFSNNKHKIKIFLILSTIYINAFGNGKKGVQYCSAIN